MNINYLNAEYSSPLYYRYSPSNNNPSLLIFITIFIFSSPTYLDIKVYFLLLLPKVVSSFVFITFVAAVVVADVASTLVLIVVNVYPFNREAATAK